ncbi:glycerol kinase GlpK [Caldisericum exile]|uniref:Glycerol kinase n=1 Tax=Caldisericum exile (strain DSM 21853 / NBRC 104410 / AZM16c01) TaxID=511051 RepID=A0A7U6GFW5_CALEA|nr:glycerol kinase GlpK [Caldisericum exile]BAL81566.1 glycerol kinase [Caldisericum exile AZM16c01]
MEKKFVGAIDQGTTSTRFIIFDRFGNPVEKSQIEHKQIFPKPGWVEHDPVEIWENTKFVIRDVIERKGISPCEIASIGITNQRETTIVWDKNTGKPFYNAIVWQDTRTKDGVEKLIKDGFDDWFRIKTGLPISTYFSALKLKWILENVSFVKEEANKGNALFGTIDTYLIWLLTGGPNGGKHITDVTNASRTMLLNIEKLEWDEEILKILDIPLGMLPEIRPSSDPNLYGFTKLDFLNCEIPIGGALGDQQAALVGQTCFAVGEAKNTYGTGCFLLLNTGSNLVRSRSGLLTTVAYKFGKNPPYYALEGSIAITGALVQWLRDNLKIINKSSDIEELARSVPDNGGVYFVPAFSGLFAPYWRTDARGVIIGLTRYANRGHIARAALEATAFQTKDVIDAMEHDSNIKLEVLKVDGGMVVNELLMQFQSDILSVPVVRPKVIETTALGASYVAGLAVKLFTSEEELRKNWAVDKIWTPNMDENTRNNLYKRWLRAIEKSLNLADE